MKTLHYYFVCTSKNSICCCFQFQRYRSVGKMLGCLVCLLFIVSYFQSQFFYNHLVVISIMVCVTIWLTHGSINFPGLYKLTYTLIGDLLSHVYNGLYCSWSNALLCYIVNTVAV